MSDPALWLLAGLVLVLLSLPGLLSSAIDRRFPLGGLVLLVGGGVLVWLGWQGVGPVEDIAVLPDLMLEAVGGILR
ncbi:MAG: hypothetical protein ACU0BF_10340 [Paracoccaceae bacterium]